MRNFATHFPGSILSHIMKAEEGGPPPALPLPPPLKAPDAKAVVSITRTAAEPSAALRDADIGVHCKGGGTFICFMPALREAVCVPPTHTGMGAPRWGGPPSGPPCPQRWPRTR